MTVEDDNKTQPTKKVKRERRKIKHGVYVYSKREEVPRERNKRGRKKKYDSESKATNTVNHSDFSYRINEFFKQTIDKKNQIMTFKIAMEEYGVLIKCMFPNVNFADDKQKKDFADNYSHYKNKFSKDNGEKIKRIRESNKDKLIAQLSDENIKKYILENMTTDIFQPDSKGTYVFDLSRMSQEAEGLYATFSQKTFKDEEKINEFRNMLTVQQLKMDAVNMELNYGEIFLRKSEIITELEGNNLNNMLIQKTKEIIKSTDEQLENINELPTASEILITTNKQKILDMYKTGKDIAKKI